MISTRPLILGPLILLLRHRSRTILVLGQDRSQTKKSVLVLGLTGLVLCCKTRSWYARRHNDLEGHNNFSSAIYSFSMLGTSLLWRSTVAFTYLKVKSANWVPLWSGGLGLVILVLILVLRIWCCLHHWRETAHIGPTRPHRPVRIWLAFYPALQYFIFIISSFIRSEKCNIKSRNERWTVSEQVMQGSVRALKGVPRYRIQ